MDMSKNNSGSNLPIIGASEWVAIGNQHKIPAKTDTGATSSAIWASHLEMSPDGTLSFQLFDENYHLYTGQTLKRTAGNYKVGIMRSSNGQEEVRYRVYLSVVIAGKTIRALFSLADRSKNTFPILIGRRTIAGKFLVDPSLQNVHLQSVPKQHDAGQLSQELSASPFTFHQKYVINKERRAKK